ncbi:CLUMA_CG001662, isoform A [Clunio marinus]|uniref:CLUMA_CG001662, isoform A n=1 Tax=Clunio marinus TaxID=568069 RepID=A0A1J1HIY2_9DIPT|nr:CLUMA_CG001662, isoform A [Clunio marinus]
MKLPLLLEQSKISVYQRAVSKLNRIVCRKLLTAYSMRALKIKSLPMSLTDLDSLLRCCSSRSHSLSARNASKKNSNHDQLDVIISFSIK